MPLDMVEVSCPHLLELADEHRGDDTAKAVAGCLGACLSLWLLTTPLSVIIAARACITPHLKMERKKR